MKDYAHLRLHQAAIRDTRLPRLRRPRPWRRRAATQRGAAAAGEQ